MGTSGALVGALVLAVEINKNPGNRNLSSTTPSGGQTRILRLGFPQGPVGTGTLRTMGAVSSFLHLPELAA